MSVSTVTKGGPTFQPYQCHICQSRFTRHENLKRHATLHSRPRKVDSLSCAFCQASFSRPDLRTRHMKRKHPEQDASQWSTAASRLRGGGHSSGAVPRTASADKASPTSVSPRSAPFATESQIGPWQVYGSSDEGTANPLYPESASNYPNSTPGSSPTGDDGHSVAVLGSSPGSYSGSRPPIMRHQRQHQLHDHHFQSQHYHSQTIQNAGSPAHLEADSLLAPFSPPRAVSFDPSLTHFDFSLPKLRDNWLPSASQTDSGFHLYFTHVSHFVPFLHQPTFDASVTADYLRLAMMCLAYQYGEDPDSSYDEDSGANLSVRCYHRSRALVALAEDDPVACSDPPQTVAMVQAYLLLQIFAMLYLPSSGVSGSNNTNNSGGNNNNNNNNINNNNTSSGSNSHRYNTPNHSIGTASVGAPSVGAASISSEPASTSANGIAMHARLIALARAGGLMQPLPVEPMATQDLHSLWMQFVKNESHKRTLFAVHQLDALWYQLLSIPRSISHLEIKHDLPCPEDYWTAPSAAEWAHRKLMTGSNSGGGGGSSSPVSYAEAVRRFLSSDADTMVVLPPFDAYGAINIAQFLISSAREISGWSTITGVLSLERLQPLKSSLIALSPSIHPEPETAKATHAALMCEAIWEIAMIELQLWSPAHTDGIVGGSIDALLRQSTQLPPLSRFLCESTTAHAIQPHVDWFLHYLEASVSPSLEAPWIPLYAYKAFLIAYQLVCEGIAGAMHVVGVQDGDAHGALLWAEKVFRRRRRWHLGRVILDCLGRLDKPE